MMPENMLRNIFMSSAELRKREERQSKAEDPSKFQSTKTLILKRLHRQARQLGPDYSLLKLKKSKDLAIELWHEVFNFISNNDQPPAKIIYNDFEIFCEILDLKVLTSNAIREMYFNFAQAEWRSILSLNIENFALVTE